VLAGARDRVRSRATDSPLSECFGEIHGIDVSDEMVAMARDRLRNIPHCTFTRSLALIWQASRRVLRLRLLLRRLPAHPSEEVIFQYLREVRRVLKTGASVHCQINGLPQVSQALRTPGSVHASAPNRLAGSPVNTTFNCCLEGALTQYMWTTWRKRACRLGAGTRPAARRRTSKIRAIGNCTRGAPMAPASRDALRQSQCGSKIFRGFRSESRRGAPVDRLSGGLPYIGLPNRTGSASFNVIPSAGCRTGILPSRPPGGESIVHSGMGARHTGAPDVPRYIGYRWSGFYSRGVASYRAP